ncbi:copper chaperone [Chromobacterium subtsugae]|nr:DUF2182 domain-containing protein [Chromobacterium subtsugae]KUM05066.1 hypothetical protein Cv017_11145 [Chromobacterium subtsugae]MBW7569037.1 DUF2182 domain-containing protein [Chromobacterium subtsugae]WSE93694.1 DUF2182 domain-containing protein [Chromobacterium subtsugae]WVH62071.1 DUF2182 domain-containing protein [Chromobacterium subtsugae]
MARMLPDSLFRLPWPARLAMAAGWLGLLWRPSGMADPGLCFSSPSPGAGWLSLRAAWEFNSATALAASWLCMLLAMMPPLLGDAMDWLKSRTLSRHLQPAHAVFLSAYLAAWMAAGAAICALAMLLQAFSPAGGPLFLAAAATLAWQASPAKRLSLAQCHRPPPLATFGIRAYASWTHYGFRHGFWCVASCWPWMLLPMTHAYLHWPLMLFAALFVWRERLAPLPAPGWRWPLALRPRRAAAIPRLSQLQPPDPKPFPREDQRMSPPRPALR